MKIGKCENLDCVQKECGRLSSDGAVYDFKQICTAENNFKWFDGKSKISNENSIELEEICVENTNSQEEV